jgi:transposase
MPAPKKYSDELRVRATRMALDAIAAEGRAEIDAGTAPSRTSDDAVRIAELEREVR